MKHDIPLMLSRHCFTPRDVARAGDIWRSFQDAALVGSSRVGWPPSRYREEGIAFIVRTMTVVHHREIKYGEPVRGQTWVSEFRRRIITPRQIVLYASDEPAATATQEWVHVRERIKEGEGIAPARASEELIASFDPVPEGPVATLPSWTDADGPESRFVFEVWHTDMDPLAHVNHPLYLDWCDEATSRVIRAAGVDPQNMVPVAEFVKWRQAVIAGETIEVRTKRMGRTGTGATVLSHQLVKLQEPEVLAAEAITIRDLVEGPGSLGALFD
ncbi:MAG: acyl-CoA thioesterase [Proteobacteria bacterium]|nr:acyl-CoA thioesterase [Pseudomonadota bacterium]